MDNLLGQELGEYYIKEIIGCGGMAVVFKAYQAKLDRDVAIKVLPPQLGIREPNFAKRFRLEARSIARLNHPYILPVYDFGLDENYHFIAMRYVEGRQTLRDVMKQPLDHTRTVELIGQVAGALEYAHKRGIIHRDLKPSNVLINEGLPLLADFGLVKLIEAPMTLTQTDAAMGTPAYMSPEQIRAKPVDHRIDIYALGVILYEILTGSIPHKADAPLSVMYRRASEPPGKLRELNPNIPRRLETVTLKALAPDPRDRYDSALDFATDLQKAYQTSFQIIKDEVTRITPPAKPVQKKFPAKVLVAMLVVLCVGAGLLTEATGFLPARARPTNPVTEQNGAAVPNLTTEITLSPDPNRTSTPLPPSTTPPALVPTKTLLPSATPTATATASPTVAPSSTHTVRPSPTPSPTTSPTAAVLALPPNATPSVYPTPQPLPPSGPIPAREIVVVSLVQPLDGAVGSDKVMFEWAANQPPPRGQFFELLFWKAREDPLSSGLGISEATLDRRVEVDLKVLDDSMIAFKPGEYMWGIALVEKTPYKRLHFITDNPRWFHYYRKK